MEAQERVRAVGPIPSKAQVEEHPERVVGNRVFRFSAIPSTMDEAWRLAREGAAEGTVVVTAHQSRGRGRFGRPWLSQPGTCLLLSVVLHPPVETVNQVPMIGAVAVVRAVRYLTDIRATVKWPNDVRIGGKKVCGILAEGEVAQSGATCTILGIGLNVSLDFRRYPEIAETATSLAHEAAGAPPPIDKAEEALLKALDDVYMDVSRGQGVFEEWKGSLDTLGQYVEVVWRDAAVRGTAVDVDGEGRLVVEQADGSRVALTAGEVTMQGGSL